MTSSIGYVIIIGALLVGVVAGYFIAPRSSTITVYVDSQLQQYVMTLGSHYNSYFDVTSGVTAGVKDGVIDIYDATWFGTKIGTTVTLTK
jgi:Ca2+/Na+ antiporter